MKHSPTAARHTQTDSLNMKTTRNSSKQPSHRQNWQMPTRFIMGLAMLLTLSPRGGFAQATPTPPERMSYQGYLVNANGIALATNAPQNFDIIFRIWNDQSATAAANRLWAEQQTVTVDRGYFSVLLGEGSQYASEPHTNLSALFAGTTASERYMEFTVKGIGSGGADVKILPRLKLLSSPYAFLAKNANALLSPNGESLVTTANGQLTVNGTISGNGSGLATLNASQLTSGTVPNSRLSGTYGNALTLNNSANSFNGIFNGTFSGTHSGTYSGNGSGLTTLNANNISSGTLADGRLSSNVAMRNAANTFSGYQTLNGGFTSSGANGSFSTPFYGPGGGTALGVVLTATGANGPQLRFQRGSDGRFFDIGQNGSGGFTIEDSDIARLTIDKNGLVGIGTTAPSKAALEVNAQSGLQPGYNPSGYLNTSGSHVGSVGSGNASIWAAGWVFGNTFVAFSDERIKDIKGQSDGAADLKTLLGIQVTDYTYRDTVAKGTAPQKKVVAQQVEQVYPQAVTKSTDVVPDIYRKATIKDGWVQLATDLKVGDRVKLISANEAGVHAVLAVRPDAFRTDFNPDSTGAPVAHDLKDGALSASATMATNQVFVYGREVNDFRSVDYEAIAMLNVSATQELAKRLEKLEARERQLADLEAKAAQVTLLEKEMAELKQAVAKLAEGRKETKQTAWLSPSGAEAGSQQVAFTGINR